MLVILGILAALVVPKFSGRTEQARETAARSQIATFGTALDAFEVDNGSYPKGRNGLQDLVQQPRDAENWKGPYLKGEIPLDPWGSPYIYAGLVQHRAQESWMNAISSRVGDQRRRQLDHRLAAVVGPADQAGLEQPARQEVAQQPVATPRR